MNLAGILGEDLDDIEVQEDGALTVPFEGTFTSLNVVNIADGLDMVSLHQLVAWDVPLNSKLRSGVAEQANKTNFGTVTLVERGKRADVVLRYNFPAGGLSDSALRTLVLLVLTTGAGVRDALGV